MSVYVCVHFILTMALSGTQSPKGLLLSPPPWPDELAARSLSSHYVLHGSGSLRRITNQALCLQAHDSIAPECPLFHHLCLLHVN